MAKILGYTTYSREPEWFTLAPIGAVNKLLKELSLQVGDVGLFEISEAFAVVAMAAIKELDIPHEKANVHGGAVALGHPIGASGARPLVTLLNAMKQRGVAHRRDIRICIGGGEAVAMAVELCDASDARMADETPTCCFAQKSGWFGEAGFELEMIMNDQSENFAEQGAAFQKIWLDSMSKLMQAAFTFSPNSTPAGDTA